MALSILPAAQVEGYTRGRVNSGVGGCAYSVEFEMDKIESPAWFDEIRYTVLLHFPEVRDQIANCAAQTKSRMTGEQFLGLCDTAFIPVAGVSVKKLATIVQPIYANLGVRTGKKRTELLPLPGGRIIVGVLCSLARGGQNLRKVEQAEDGCLLEAAIPSDIWSFEGDLFITVKHHPPGTLVEAAAVIKGQLFDWGKSKRCLEQLFSDLRNLS